MQSRFALILVLSVTLGCSSIRSTMIHRNETDTGWQKERMLCGVPVTVKMPTHLKVMVVEHHYLRGGTTPEFVDLDVPLRSVVTDFIYTDKIFTVDPKRPGAGTLNSTLTFEGQYFKAIDNKVVDKTIEDITGLVKAVAKKGLVPTPTGIATAGDVSNLRDTKLNNLAQVDSVAATAIFDIEASDLELQVAGFLARHLNGCHTCQVVAPGVKQPHRLPPLLDEPCAQEGGQGFCPSGVPR